MTYQDIRLKAMKDRHSTRTFDGRPVEKSERDQLKRFIEKACALTCFEGRIAVFDTGRSSIDKLAKMQTYGFIRDAKTFLAVIVKRDYDDFVKLGYLFEQIILYATSLNLASCWLGGTFRKADVKKFIEVSAEETVLVLVPIGYEKSEKRLMEAGVRIAARSHQRKPFGELFFDKNLKAPLKEDVAEPYAQVLNMVRLAPSAVNKQPWRIVQVSDGYDFYLCHSIGWKAAGFELQKIDIGIAMCHFELAVKACRLEGFWCIRHAASLESSLEYVASWMTSGKTDQNVMEMDRSFCCLDWRNENSN